MLLSSLVVEKNGRDPDFFWIVAKELGFHVPEKQLKYGVWLRERERVFAYYSTAREDDRGKKVADLKRWARSQKDHHLMDRLRSLISNMSQAKAEGELKRLRKLISRADKILPELTEDDFRKNVRAEIEEFRSWLTSAMEKERASRALNAAVESVTGIPRRGRAAYEPCTPREIIDLADRVRPLLEEAARAQKTLTWIQLYLTLGNVALLRTDDQVAVLAEVDRPLRETGPMLSAILALPGDRVDPLFRKVLDALGYEVPQTEKALQVVWARESQRIHAYHAVPPRELPPSHVPRRSVAGPA